MLTFPVGNIILATGYELFDARRIPQYGYGRLANVFTSLEIRAAVQCGRAHQRQHGAARRQDDAEAVGIMHCVGSRDRNYNNYCSVICCMQSLKFAHLVTSAPGRRSTTSTSTCARRQGLR